MSEQARFEAWMRKVDAHVSARTGLDTSDLPDMCYRDWFDDEYTPQMAAEEVFAENGVDW